MAAITALQAYGSEDESSGNGSETEDKQEDSVVHLKPLEKGNSVMKIQDRMMLNSAPVVDSKEEVGASIGIPVDFAKKEVSFNPTYEQLFAPKVGPVHPFKTFHSYGYALDPSSESDGTKIVGLVEEAKKNEGKTVFETTAVRPGDKRKKVRKNDPSDIDGYLGPWGKYVDEKTVSVPTEEEKEELDEILAKRSKKGKKQEEKAGEEKSTLHIKDAYDYQDRSFLHIPMDLDVDLKSTDPPEKCYLPKKLLHTWTGHTKGVAAIKLFPQSGHLLLSCGMDSKIKLWEVYNKRRVVRTYIGHKQAVRDACFNNSGDKFISAGYDRYMKIWDTETGECISRFTNNKVPYCVKFNPDEDKQHIFVAGMADKKIVQWDTRANEIVQEYDRHLGAVNTITFIDQNRRFVTTSDDKSIRLWEWDIPVDFKYIAEPNMYPMPSVTLSPNGKWLGFQSMDNQILIYGAQNRLRLNRKKNFKGHMVAGYACQMGFSPDMSYVVSGDADGKLNIWDWKTTKLFNKFKAHDGVSIGCIWHPHETSKVITCGWDGLIKLWD
ncbi:pre-mRNA-processing factor 17-like isoform X3 [Antedon mediterranea]|uniref:pre-mRNA-processing factor 17-like isoform X3 n=1 Tax=Antedon mediterranea TaxID=105859 RepID=UPI003AF6E283